MPPATWTAWKIDAQGNRIEKQGDGSMPADPFDASVPGTTTVNGTPQPSNNNNAPPPPENSNPVANPESDSAPDATTPPPPPPPPATPPATPPPPPAAAAPTDAPTPTPPTPPAAAPPAAAVSLDGAVSPSPPPSVSTAPVSGLSGASATDIGAPGSSSGGLSTTAIAIISSFAAVFVVIAILGAVYMRKRRSKERLTSVQAALEVRRSSSTDRAQVAGFASTNLLKSTLAAKPKSTTPTTKPKSLATKRGVQSHLSLSKIGAPVLIRATTDQEILDTAIPAGVANDDATATNIMLQLGFESVPVSPRASEFGNVSLGDAAEGRTSSDHMRVHHSSSNRHTRDPSFDFSRVDPSASMGGLSSNYLVASPKIVVHRDRSSWEDSGAAAAATSAPSSSTSRTARSPPSFGSRRF